MSVDERTITFAVWPHLITLEGPADELAAVIQELYDDPGLPREQWALGNTDGVRRRALVERLRTEGKVARRVGLAALTPAVSDAIEARVRARGVKCFAMHLR
ncbi:MAG TPA: hypothetical protein VMD47_11640 [Candidatus Acidoferrales bacterium]|nr:hypothetical protein [Candidatus Acidoferrales bacterium]